jgi:hypothetical protein
MLPDKPDLKNLSAECSAEVRPLERIFSGLSCTSTSQKSGVKDKVRSAPIHKQEC